MASWHGGCQQSGWPDAPVQDTFQGAVEMEWLKMYEGQAVGLGVLSLNFTLDTLQSYVWICWLTWDLPIRMNVHAGNRLDCRSCEGDWWWGREVEWHQKATVIQVGQVGMNWAVQGAPWSESVQWPAGCNLHRDPWLGPALDDGLLGWIPFRSLRTPWLTGQHRPQPLTTISLL